MRFLTFVLFSLFLYAHFSSNAQEGYRLVFWNVENLFDTFIDSTVNDGDFTPEGNLHWTENRYNAKLTNIAKTITAIGGTNPASFEMPLLIAMAEVENDKVLRDLCRGTPLRKFGYEFIHFDSPDIRGIDNALLYRPEFFKPYHCQSVNVSDSSKGFFTRDILWVEGKIADDTLVLLICHLPSKRGGVRAGRQRVAVAQRLGDLMDSLSTAHPMSAIVVMGDMNSDPKEQVIQKHIIGEKCSFVNLMASAEPGKGSYNYKGHWSFLDQIFVLRSMTDKKCPLQIKEGKGSLFDADFLLEDDERRFGRKPSRTYLGPVYKGGYSDHLPVFTDIKKLF